MKWNNLSQKVANNTNLPKDVVETIYKSFWAFIKTTIEEMPLKTINIEELQNIKTSFNIPSIGKFYINIPTYIKQRQYYAKNRKD